METHPPRGSRHPVIVTTRTAWTSGSLWRAASREDALFPNLQAYRLQDVLQYFLGSDELHSCLLCHARAQGKSRKAKLCTPPPPETPPAPVLPRVSRLILSLCLYRSTLGVPGFVVSCRHKCRQPGSMQLPRKITRLRNVRCELEGWVGARSFWRRSRPLETVGRPTRWSCIRDAAKLRDTILSETFNGPSLCLRSCHRSSRWSRTYTTQEIEVCLPGSEFSGS